MLDFLKELSRRKVWLFGGIYLALGWVLLQVAVVVETTLSLPPWVDQIALVLLTLGFPVALLLAWAQESQGGHKVSAVTAEAASPKEPPEALKDTRPSFSIAVLPFDDLSSEGAFAESADVIAEDALTQLSHFGTFKVAARNSSFAYKGASFDMRDLGAQLGVRFVLEGSLRSKGDKVRVTAQLIETLSGDHVWSRNFDLGRSEIETGLDEVVDGLSGGISAVIIDLEIQRLEARAKDDLSADELMNLAKYKTSIESLPHYLEAETFIEASLAKRPNHGQSLAFMAQIQMGLAGLGAPEPEKHQQSAEDYLQRAKSVGRPDFDTLVPLATVANMMRRVSEANALAEQMRDLAPRHPGTWAVTTTCHTLAGRHEEALISARKAKSLTSIRGPHYANILSMEAGALVSLGNYAEAEACARKSVATSPRSMAQIALIVSLAQQGKVDEASLELARAVETLSPEGLTMKDALDTHWLIVCPQDLDGTWREGLRLAGLKDDAEESDV